VKKKNKNGVTGGGEIVKRQRVLKQPGNKYGRVAGGGHIKSLSGHLEGVSDRQVGRGVEREKL